MSVWSSLNHRCHSTNCVPVGPRTRRVVSAQSGIKGVCLSVCIYCTCSTCTLYMYMYIFDYVGDCTGSSESADPNTTGGGVTSKREGFCLVL